MAVHRMLIALLMMGAWATGGAIGCVSDDPRVNVVVADAAQPEAEAGPAGCGDAGAPKTVFVTSKAYAGDFGGLNGADEKCNALAKAANLPGTYTAWLSIGSVSAASRLPTCASGFKRTDGELIANSVETLLAGSLLKPIILDENKTPVVAATAEPRVWTNSLPNGRIAQIDHHCEEFTTIAPPSGKPRNAPAGNASATDGTWTFVTTDEVACNADARLYCFEN